MRNLYALILAGGSGTRLWPVSRQAAPKQLMKVASDASLFEETVNRISRRVPPDRMIFVTSRDLEHDIRDQLRRCLGERSSECLVVGEPVGRNTAPAVLLAAALVRARDPEALLLSAPSDHVIRDVDAFTRAIDDSLEAAASGMIVTYGVDPTRPETGYGYIKAGAPRGKVRSVERFEEKPTADRARAFLEDGSYTWNSGIFLFAVETILEEAGRFLPEVVEALGQVDPRSLEGLEEAYAAIEPVSLDHGIMERTGRAAVLPVTMGWSDLGSWDSLYEILERDASGNVVSGDALSLGNEGCLIMGGDRYLAVTGMRDAIIVQTEDATLICPRGRSQEVRRIVEDLERGGRPERLVHPTVRRPWGSYTVLTRAERYKVKRMKVDPGQKMSLQKHEMRSEHWVVVTGEVVVTRGEETVTLTQNEGITIPIGTVHRIENRKSRPAELVEVQLGDYVEEDDIVRFEDDYGRNGPPDRRKGGGKG